MPRIPRTEASVRVSYANQPTMSPDALTGPGRALQGLGRAIGGLGADLQAAADAGPSEDERYKANLELVKFQNEQDLAEANRQASFTGDPEGYTGASVGDFDEKRAELLGRLPQHPKIQQSAMLHTERMRGARHERAFGFERTQKHGQLITTIDETATMEVGTAQPGNIPQLTTKLRGVDAMIDAAPGLSPAEKGALRDKMTAQSLSRMLEGVPDEDKLDVADKIIKDWTSELQPIEPGQAPQQGQPGSPSGPAVEPPPTGTEFRPDLRSDLGGPETPSQTGEQSNNRIVRAVEGGKGYTTVEYADGRIERRTGMYGWRNNNPGNIENGEFAKKFGGMNGGGRYAVFPDEESGLKAAESLFFDGKNYKDLSIKAAVERWAPYPENSRAAQASYAKSMAEAAGVSVDTITGTLNPEQRRAALLAQKGAEGNVAGSVETIAQGQATANNLGLLKPEAAEKIQTGGSAFEVAKSFIGADERRDASALSKFFEKTSGQKLNPAQTAWCAAFVNATLAANGQKGTNDLMARSFLKVGTPTKEPSKGDIVVLTRSNPNSPYGHVGFYAGRDKSGNILVLGGNQGDRVSVKPYAASRVLGFRVPPQAGEPIPTEVAGAQSGTAMGLTNPNAGNMQGVQVADASGAVPQSATMGRGENTIPGASAQPVRPVLRPSVRGSVVEKLLQMRPSLVEAKQRALAARIERAEKSAAEGYKLPEAERSVLRDKVTASGDRNLLGRLDAAEAAADYTETLRQGNLQQVKGEAQRLREELNQGGGTPELIARTKAVEGLAANMEKGLSDDSIGWAEKSGAMPPVEPVTPENFTKEALLQRKAVADQIGERYGMEYRQFFRAGEEKAQIEAAFTKGGDDMVNMLATMYEAFGDDTPKAVAEIAPKNPEAVRAAYLASTGGDPKAVKDIAETILRRKDENYTGAPKFEVTQLTADFETVTGDLFKDDRLRRDEVMTTAKAIYENRVADPAVYEANLFRESVGLALGSRKGSGGLEYGGPMTQDGTDWSAAYSGGNTILIPSNIRKDMWNPLLDGITEKDLVAAGHPMPADSTGKPLPLLRALSHSEFRQVGPNQFALFRKADPYKSGERGGYLMTAAAPKANPDEVSTGDIVESMKVGGGDLFVLDLEKLTPILRERMPSAFWKE